MPLGSAPAATAAPPLASRQLRRLLSASFGVLCAAILGLAGCATTHGVANNGVASERAVSPDGSRAYREYAEKAQAEGLLRDDAVASDLPYDAALLARNFERVVFDQEAQKVSVNPAATTQVYRLTRWDAPIRYRFAGDAAQPADRAAVAALTARLSQVGVSLALAQPGETANMIIAVMTPKARDHWYRSLGDQRRKQLRNTLVEAWVRTVNVPCAGMVGRSKSRAAADRRRRRERRNADADALAAAQAGVERDFGFNRAMIFIKSELTGAHRESCFQEEIAQSLGLLNDHDDVRPSIFNDRNEFAVVTNHDLDLLRILYDERLKPGMTRDRAMPIVRRIVRERWAQGSAMGQVTDGQVTDGQMIDDQVTDGQMTARPAISERPSGPSAG